MIMGGGYPVYEVSVETGFTAAHIPSACKGNAFRAGLETKEMLQLYTHCQTCFQIIKGKTYFFGVLNSSDIF